jgi:hypothetical protein
MSLEFQSTGVPALGSNLGFKATFTSGNYKTTYKNVCYFFTYSLLMEV